MNIGTLISDKYEILHEIKRGGFGIVYKGLDTHLGKKVAIKTIDPALLENAKHVDMFQQEALSIAKLNHQNIVQIYDIKRNDEDQLFLVMEYIDGPDFMTLLKACRSQNKSLPIHLGVYVLAEVCNGLDYAHNRRHKETNEPLNFVHQDISPENIMLTRSGQVKIIDFGIANLKRLQPQKRKDAYIQGKINYMAPEQVNGKMVIDRRTDIFAIGLILFEFLIGERFIRANDDQEVLETLVTGAWDPLRLDSESIPENLRQIVKQALEHHPKNRYDNAKLLYKDLMHYLILNAPSVDFTSEISDFIAKLGPEQLSYNGNATHQNYNSMVTESPNPDAEQATSEPARPTEFNEEAETLYDISDDPVNNFTDGNTDLETKDAPLDHDDSKYDSFVEEDEDDQRTIIDVVRLSARTHKKGITLSFLGIVFSFILFTVVDTFARFTPIGTEIYDFLFPPAIKLVSVPAGASVYLDNKLLNETTPLGIDQISPGVHKLVLTLPQFEPIVKSINVPRSGTVNVSGENHRHASQPYILRFKSQLEITSKPAGASIFINDVKINQKTPANVFWEVTEKPIDIRLEHAELPSLTGLQIDCMEGKEIIDDVRLWEVEPIQPDRAQFSIEGIFHKTVTINSYPSEADIYLNDDEQPIGVTGSTGTLMLSLGSHLITLRKEGFLSRSFSVNIDKDSPNVINNALLRRVRIYSRDIWSHDPQDLGAKIVELVSKKTGRTIDYTGTTPAALNLLPYSYTAKLLKDGYRETIIEIQPSDRSVVAKMQLIHLKIPILAIDAITNDPIKGTEITYAEQDSENANTLGLTDVDGQIIGELPPGTYQITAKRQGYAVQTKNLRVQRGEDSRLIFRLTLLR
ncbi:protein kinase [candidate division KSB1 bacterium]|nr:protein kinase [candidate division KSB1 bacterium]NIR70192.1 protein kinase [candidate division KSB1 bacterium]NIS27579.1 protein kinase [candidate division KSB1 bacterium]NIT74431.1 protein kinase [candidate division KSB1 bacterium]NIU28296.1 protein kinase [candidate division KSB1 bacterium]